MILQALYQLAQREGLMEDPDFEPKPVAWLVRVAADGRFLGFQDNRTDSPPRLGKGKLKRTAIPRSMPREKPVTSGDRAFLLFNKAEYALGIDPDGNRDPAKLQRRFALFREKTKTCLDETGDEGVRGVCTFLEDLAAGRQSVALPLECASNDLFAFVYTPDIDRLVTDRPKVREYWQNIRKGESKEPKSDRSCLVSGEALSGVVQNFPPIKKVPGGTTSGVGLVSFNKNAFESYGWSGNNNAPISRNASESCATALNRLLDPAYPDPRQPGQTLPQRSLRLSSDTTVCYWSAEKSGDEFTSAFGGLLEAKPEIVKELYRSIWSGKLPDIEDKSAFTPLP
jgi:CRISPR-associated protein Csd1